MINLLLSRGVDADGGVSLHDASQDDASVCALKYIHRKTILINPKGAVTNI